jgi:hypothetical protein
MINSAKQSRAKKKKLDCFVASLLAMTNNRKRYASDATHSISISIFGSGNAWTTQVVRAG